MLPADPAGQFEDQPEGDAGGRIAEAAGAADDDAALGAGLHVDRGVVGAGGDEELELRHAVDHLAGKAGALAHHHDDVEILEVADGVGVAAADRLGEHLDLDVLGDLRPVGELERHVLVVVEDRAAIGHVSTPWMKRAGVCRGGRGRTRDQVGRWGACPSRPRSLNQRQISPTKREKNDERPPIHLSHAGSDQDLSGQPQGPRKHQPVVLSGRQDRRARRQRLGQVDAAAHHGRHRQGLHRRGLGRRGRARRLSGAGAAARSGANRVRENVMEGVAAKKALLDRYNEIAANYTDETADEMAKLQDEIDAKNLWDLDSQVDLAMDALRCPPDDADVDQALGRRAPPRRAVPAAARPAGAAAARRADQPSRRRVRALAGRPSARLSGRDPDRHPRPLLPRQRHRLDSRARSRPAAFPTRATTRPGWCRSRSGWSRKAARTPRTSARSQREQEWIAASPKARQAKSKARYERYEDLLKKANEKQTQTAQIVIPVAERLGQNVVDFEGPAEGLRRQPADRRSHLQAAARRHRRRHRPERRRQDHAVPHDHRAGEAGRRHDQGRRVGPARLCRSVARLARRQEERLGGNLRRPGPASCSARRR